MTTIRRFIVAAEVECEHCGGEGEFVTKPEDPRLFFADFAPDMSVVYKCSDCRGEGVRKVPFDLLDALAFIGQQMEDK